ncbi:MAG: radical SAM protein [Halanaerobiales bacterium]|nr:radical SAM protein [Halanaerobiales bacterium]
MAQSLYNIQFKDSNGQTIIYNCLNERFLSIGKYTLETLLNDATEEDLHKLLELNYFMEDEKKQEIIERYKRIKEQKKKFSLVVSVCETCNLACIYCYQASDGQDSLQAAMSPETEEQLLKFITKIIQDYDQLHICWFGGEPLINLNLIKRLTDQIEAAAKLHNCQVTYEMISNGYIFTKELAEYFTKYDFNRVQITFDGDQDVHDQYRITKGRKGTFEKILQNISQICEYINVTIRINVQKNNIQSVKKLLH